MLISTSVLAQQTTVGKEADRLKKSEIPIEKEKQKKQKIYFNRDLKIGWDISNLLIGAISPKRSGLDFSVDYTLKKNFYGIIEIGKNSYEEKSDALNYSSEGTYFRIGFDSDMRKDEKNISKDFFYLGTRYAFAIFEQRIENYQLSSEYWPIVSGETISFNNQAHWIEAISGFKVEVFKNMYLGLGLRFKFLIFQSGDKTIKPATFIPGYGKSSGLIVTGFSYNLYYNLPFKYSQKKPNRGN